MDENKRINVVVQNVKSKPGLLKFIALAVIAVLIVTNIMSFSGRRNDKKAYEQNNAAMKKELVTEKNKNGELQTSVAAFTGREKDLKEYSEELYAENKALKNRKPKVITKFETVYRADTATANNTTIDTVGLDKDEYRLSWDYHNEDSTRFLAGNSTFFAKIMNNRLDIRPNVTTITDDQLRLDFVTGLVTNKETGLDEIFITPKNPNVTIGSIEGAVIEKSDGLGINLSLSAGYGFAYVKDQLGTGPVIALTLSKPLIKF